jgi:hypothetical protein
LAGSLSRNRRRGSRIIAGTEKAMIRWALLVVALSLPFGTAFAADCAEQAVEKKLAGAAKTSFLEKCQKDASSCTHQAAEKKLAGAAKTSFLGKCQKDAQTSCDASAAEKKLAGAAKTSFVNKCVKDAVGQ